MAGAANAASPRLAGWRRALLLHINRAKRYPREARRNGEQGTAHLRFSLDRTGRILDARIVRGSGSSALDRETIAMIQRASPLPAPPAEVQGTRITLTVPVRFDID